MALPEPFSDVEHVQAVIRRYINREIREHFSDLGGDDWDPDITTTRGSMRKALTHEDSDPIQLTLARLFIYYFIYGQAKALMPDIYGIPNTAFDQVRIYRPQVCLYFSGSEAPQTMFTSELRGKLAFA